MKSILRVFWVFLSFLGWVALAEAGTYNFYINNTEQGDNGVSTPTVTVKDGKGEASEVPKTEAKPEAKQAPAENPNVFPAAEPSGTVPTEPVASGSLARAKRPIRNLFRVNGGVGATNLHTRTERDPFTADRNSDQPFWRQYDEENGSQSAYEVSGEYFPHPIVGMGVIFGKLSGVEGILAPFGATESVFQPELVVGYLGTRNGVGGEADPFVGARLNLQVHENVALLATVRKSLETNENIRYTQLLAGASFRF